MLRGGQKTSITEPSRRGRAKSNTSPAAALTDPDIAKEAIPLKGKTRDNTQPRQQEKRSILSFLLSDPRLSPEAKERIKRTATEGVNADDLAAHAHYTIELARQGYEDGELAFKDLLVAHNKSGSQLAAAAQLSQAAPGAGATVVEVRFTGTGPVSTHPDAKPRPAPDPVIGDIIDADG